MVWGPKVGAGGMCSRVATLFSFSQKTATVRATSEGPTGTLIFFGSRTCSPLGTDNCGLPSDFQRVSERPCISTQKRSLVLNFSDPFLLHDGLITPAVQQIIASLKYQMLLSFFLDSLPPYTHSSPTSMEISFYFHTTHTPGLSLVSWSHVAINLKCYLSV